jgi:hypothetical protein
MKKFFVSLVLAIGCLLSFNSAFADDLEYRLQKIAANIAQQETVIARKVAEIEMLEGFDDSFEMAKRVRLSLAENRVYLAKLLAEQASLLNGF